MNIKVIENFKKLNPILLLTIFFIVSRIIYYILGIRFVAVERIICYHSHFIPLELLKNNLLESLFYQHTQPPLHNLMAGILLKLFGGYVDCAFAGCYLVLTWLACISIFCLFRIFHVSLWPSITITALYIVNPTVVLFENTVWYTLPVMTLLLMSCAAFYEYISRGGVRFSFLFFSLLAVTALIRSMFHLLWIIFFLCALLITKPTLRRETLVGAFFPILLVLGVMLKNYFVFSMFSTSSWMWQSLVNIAPRPAALQNRKDLISKGILSPFGYGFPTPSRIKKYIKAPPPTGKGVLDQEYKCEGSAPNLNSSLYLAAREYFKRDVLFRIKNYPKIYALNIAKALQSFTLPIGEYYTSRDNNYFPGGNFYKIKNIYELYNTVSLGAWRGAKLGYFVAAAFLVIFVSGAVRAVECMKKRSLSNEDVLFFYMWVNILYVTLVPNALELGENGRFRLQIEPLLLILTVVGVQPIFSSITKKGKEIYIFPLA